MFMCRYITQQVAAEQRSAITRRVQEMFPEINLPQLPASYPAPAPQLVAAVAVQPARTAAAAAQPLGLGPYAAADKHVVRMPEIIHTQT